MEPQGDLSGAPKHTLPAPFLKPLPVLPPKTTQILALGPAVVEPQTRIGLCTAGGKGA